MKELTELLENILNERLEQIVLSDARTRELAFKVKVRPVMIKQELLFQETLYRGTQVFHHNYSKEEIAGRLSGMLGQHSLDSSFKFHNLNYSFGIAILFF